MKKMILVLSTFVAMNAAFADDACTTAAADKKLNGAAKNSFIKKCQKDSEGSARAMCEKDDVSQRTSGAAKEAHIKKCMKDASATK